jgi:hypothetical protein
MEKPNECSLCTKPCYDPFDLCGDCAEELIKQEVPPSPTGRKIVRDFNIAVSTILQEKRAEANGR